MDIQAPYNLNPQNIYASFKAAQLDPYSYPNRMNASFQPNLMQSGYNPNLYSPYALPGPNMPFQSPNNYHMLLANIPPVMPNLKICGVEKCIMCFNKGKGYELGCSHKKCSRCLLDYMYVATQGKLSGKIQCHACKMPFRAEVFFNKDKYSEKKPGEIDQPIAELPVLNSKYIELPARKQVRPPQEIKEVIPNLPTCYICKSSGELIQLECSDLICAEDLRKESLRRTNDTLCGSVACPACGKSINNSFINIAFGGEEKVIRIQNEAIRKYEKELLPQGEVLCLSTFDCQICYETFKRDQGITLDCEHVLCQNCIKYHIENLISQSQVSENEMACPSCQQPVINPYIIEAYVAPEMYERYIKLNIMGIKNKFEYIKYCPSCPAAFMIPKNMKEVTCPECNLRFCPECNNLHTDISCEEYFQQQEREKQEVEDREKAIKLVGKVQKCPDCGELQELMKGCKFVKCIVKNCQTKPNFCFVCGIKLVEAQHYSHFKKRGPFGDTCNTTDNIKE